MKTRKEELEYDLKIIQDRLHNPVLSTVPQPYRSELFNLYTREIRQHKTKINQEAQKERGG